MYLLEMICDSLHIHVACYSKEVQPSWTTVHVAKHKPPNPQTLPDTQTLKLLIASADDLTLPS